MPLFDSNKGTLRIPGPGADGELRVAGVEVTVVRGGGAEDGKTASLSGASLTVGTDPASDLVLADPTVSRHHLVLSITPDGILAEDLGTTNGTWLGPARIRSAVVPAGTMLTVGKTVLEVKATSRRLVAMKAPLTHFHGLVGGSAPMQEIYGMIEQLARTDLPVSVIGETGTGKELVGRALHQAGPRRDKPFLVLDCGVVSPELLRSELFGHEKGAFTGADKMTRGILEEAQGGTVFLDEVGELQMAVQPHLLRALETRQITRIGSRTTINVQLRVVSATNKDLSTLVEEGKFRADLLYRLSAVTVYLPPLRERRDDIPALFEHFLTAYRDRHQVAVPAVSAGAMEALSTYAWPGNVREMRNLVDVLCALHGSGRVEAEHVRKVLTKRPPGEVAAAAPPPAHASLDAAERAVIEQTLDECEWNKREAARRLGISPTTLLKKIEKYGIKR